MRHRRDLRSQHIDLGLAEGRSRLQSDRDEGSVARNIAWRIGNSSGTALPAIAIPALGTGSQPFNRPMTVCRLQCSVDTVVCAEWHPLERNQIVSCGKGHVSFWSLDNGGMLYKRMGIFESRDKPRYVTCVAFNQNGDVLTGDSNGNIIVWTRGDLN